MKKILISLFSLFVFGAFLCDFASAQTNNTSSPFEGIVVATVRINNAKIVSQNNRDFKMSFDLSNRVGAQSQVKYSVRLTKDSLTGQVIFDQRVYDEALSLTENITINKIVEYSIPPEISAGKYQLWIESKNKNGLPLAIAFLGEVKIAEDTTNTIEIVPDSCYLIKNSDTTHYLLNQGIAINSVDKLAIKCKVKNSYSSNIIVVPNFITRNHTIFGDEVPNTEDIKESITLNKGLNDISLVIPKATSPQNYNLSFYLVPNDTKSISNTVSFNYTLVGQNGTIQNVVFDKTYYKVGEIANLQIYSTQTSTSTIAVLVSDNSGVNCAAPLSKEISNFSIINLSIPIIKDCENPKASINLSTNGNYLDSSDFQVTTVVSTSTPVTTDKRSIVFIFIILVLVVVVGIYKNNFFNRLHKINTFVLILFITTMIFGSSVVTANAVVCRPYYTSDSWCSDGVIVPGVIGTNGCRSAPKCFPLITITPTTNPVAPNLSTTISWTSTLSKTCTLYRNGTSLGDVSTTSGSVSSGAIVSDTTFLLSCVGINGVMATSSQSTVFIIPPPPVVTLNPISDPIPYNSSTTISGTVSNINSCTLTGGPIGTRAWNSNGNYSFSSGNLTSNASFSINCTGYGGGPVKIDKNILVYPAPSVGISVDASPISYGESTNVKWNSDQSTYCNITKNGELFSKAISSSQTSGPLTTTTTFIAECGNGYSTTTNFATVLVSPTLTLNANSEFISSGNSTDIYWSSQGADSCTITKIADGVSNVFSNATSSYVSSGPLIAITTFTGVCHNAYGSINKSLTIVIDPLFDSPVVPLLINLTVPQTISSGDFTSILWGSSGADFCTTTKKWVRTL